jgi:glycosyltransferase involved in cell wall biosynthesis
MRATRAWRAGEKTVRVLRHIAGVGRDLIMLASPRRFWKNTRNLALALKLAVHRERRAVWTSHFDPDYYRQAYQDVARSGVHPALHYLLLGYTEDRNPSPEFNSAFYRQRYPDVGDGGINPLLHYALFGSLEGRSPVCPPARFPAETPVPAAARQQSTGDPQVFDTTSPVSDDGEPLVSVVIPCFNYGRYVEQAIHSALSQTFNRIEVIVVEGGSTDQETPGIIRELEGKGLPNTRFVYRTEPRLVGDNRNFGIALARGRYVCCLDADDVIKPTYLEIAMFLTENCGYDIVYPSVRCFEQSDFEWILTDPAWPEIAYGNQISTVAVFRKEAWQLVGGFRDWGKGDAHVAEDWDLWVRLIGHGFRGKCIRDPLMLYRVHGNSLWRGSELKMEEQGRIIRDANPELFVDGSARAVQRLERKASHPRSIRIAGAGSRPAILFALPFISIGGAEKVFATLAQSLIERGYEIVVITTLVLAETIPDYCDSFQNITPSVYPLPRVLQNQEDRWKDFLYYLVRQRRIGAILIAGCDFLYRLLPDIAADFPNIAVFDQLFNDGVHFNTNRLYADYIDTTFVPSEALAHKLIAKSGEEPGKVCIVPHGIKFAESAVDPSFESSGLPPSFQGKFLVSFFGRLSIEKAPADFVEIARRLRSHDEIRFLMTGEGQEQTAVLALIKRYGLESRIHTPGFVDNLPSLMAMSDAVIVPSRLDGMPLVIFEAQACGKPVVASAVGSIPNVITDGQTGLLCSPGDLAGFAERILRLFRSPGLCRSIGEAARVWVRAHHSAEAMTEKYISALDRIRSIRDSGNGSANGSSAGC